MPSGIRKRHARRAGVKDDKRRARSKPKSKSKDVTSNPVIAAHWDPNETLAQNYRRLGLVSRLQKPAGGIEKKINSRGTFTKSSEISKKTGAKVGRIVRLEDGTSRIEYDDDEKKEETDITWDGFEVDSTVRKELEEYAESKVPQRRHISSNEGGWLAQLISKHNDDYKAMQWDKVLNPFQHSAGELKKRVRLFKSSNQE